MHWELWHSGSGNFIWRCASEAEMLLLVKEMLGDGWSAEHLLLGLEPDTKEEQATLKRNPVIHGEQLLQRLAAFEEDQADLREAVRVINQTARELKEIQQEANAVHLKLIRQDERITVAPDAPLFPPYSSFTPSDFAPRKKRKRKPRAR